MPDVNVDLLDGALAWRQHDGGHTDEPNVEHFIRWANTQWGVVKPAAGKAENAEKSSKRNRPSLKDAVGNRFKIGVGVSHTIVQDPRRRRFDPAAFPEYHA